jgi:hypothetical protein
MRCSVHLIQRVAGAATLALLVLIYGQAAAAEPASFNPGRSDSSLRIEAILESRPVDATGQIRVALQGAKGTVSGTSTALSPKESGAANAISENQITVEQKNIDPGAAVPLTVTIKGINRPGTYEGTITLQLPPPEPAPAQAAPAGPAAPRPGEPPPIKVALTLVVSVKPQIESPDTAVAASFSNCIRSCAFSEFVSPGAASGAATSIVIVNKSPTPLEVTGTLDLKGSTRTSVTKTVDAGKPITIKAGERQRITFDFAQKEDFAADHFTGNAVVTASVPQQTNSAALGNDGKPTIDNRTVLTIPATVDVRDAALIPLLVILLGVLAGRLSKILNDASRQARVALYPEFTFLRSQINKLTNADDNQHCGDQLDDIWSRVLQQDATDAKFKQELTNLGTKVQLLSKVESLERQVNESQFADEDKQAIIMHLQVVRTSLLVQAPDFNAVQTAITAAQNEISAARHHAQEAAGRAMVGGALIAPVPDRVFDALDGSMREIENDISARGTDAAREQSGLRNGMNNVLWFFSGIDTTDTIKFQTWFVRPLVWFVTIVVLSFYGLWLFYGGTDHATFGAKGLSEYIALFLWGIAAQTVSLTLADIQFTRH